jgi:hypothetical protein
VDGIELACGKTVSSVSSPGSAAAGLHWTLRVRGDVVHMEVSDAGDRGEHRAGECGATCNDLVLVEGGRERFAWEDLLDAVADGRHACDTSDNVIESDSRIG